MNRLSPQKQNGLTLLELLVTMAMVAILAGIAVPSYNDLINRNQQRAQLNHLVSGLQIARSEAVKRGVNTGFCVSNDGENCAGAGSWEQGWIVYVDENGDLNRDADELIVRAGEAMASGFTAISSAAINRQIMYRSSGESSATGTFTLCDNRGVNHAQAVIIRASGKPKAADHGAGGAALVCPP